MLKKKKPGYYFKVFCHFKKKTIKNTEKNMLIFKKLGKIQINSCTMLIKI